MFSRVAYVFDVVRELLNSMSVAFKVGPCHGLREPPHEESEFSSEQNNIS